MHGARVEQACLVVVVQVAITDGEVTAAHGEFYKTVPVFFVGFILTVDIAVVYPDVMRVAGGNTVGVGMMDNQVADDDILLAVDVETDTSQFGSLYTNDGLVRVDLNDIFLAIETIAFKLSIHDDGIR